MPQVGESRVRTSVNEQTAYRVAVIFAAFGVAYTYVSDSYCQNSNPRICYCDKDENQLKTNWLMAIANSAIYGGIYTYPHFRIKISPKPLNSILYPFQKSILFALFVSLLHEVFRQLEPRSESNCGSYKLGYIFTINAMLFAFYRYDTNHSAGDCFAALFRPMFRSSQPSNQSSLLHGAEPSGAEQNGAKQIIML